MAFLVKNIKLRTKLILLFAFVFLAFILIFEIYLIPSVTKTIESQVESKLKNIVQVAISICESQYALQKSGKLSESQAQQTAKEIIRGLRYNSNDYIWINDLQPKMIMHPFNQELEGQDLSDYKDPTGFKLFVAMVDVVKKKGEGFVKYQWTKPNSNNNFPKMSYVVLFKPWGWVLGTGVYIDDLVAYENNIKNSLRMITLFVLLICFLIIFLITISISRRLKQVEEFAESLSKFDLSSNKGLNTSYNDEIGKVARTFSNMSQNMKDMISQIKQVSLSVFEAAKELTSASNEIANVSEQIALAISDVAKGSTEQANSIEQSSQRLNKLSEVIEDISEKMKESYSYAQTVFNTINEGNLLINSQEENMKNVKEIWQKVESLMNQFSSMSTEIVQITSFISNLSKEINLLALNASIEASRAGEAGKGFMVVANEIRKLSDQTSSSAKQIGNLLKNIQANVENLTAGFSSFEDALKKQDEITNDTKQAYSQIIELTKKLTEIFEEINQSIQASTQDILSISTEISNIASIAQETAAATEQTAASTEEQTATAQTIASTMKRLESLAEDMMKKVEVFKV
ncbi:methyl-accepting chemotaxis protein [Caldicellulosiruptor changbaiensis]|uniref:methyl-accepting chemotaxis protein n=1 Tax=Caldicellulosiruptor changbaiensis TaxID=1222016 RepID=UPI001F495CBE|nr:methyl-accepting chemotaxis protein [Caldicellulosiruptor changbaiensis]